MAKKKDKAAMAARKRARKKNNELGLATGIPKVMPVLKNRSGIPYVGGVPKTGKSMFYHPISEVEAKKAFTSKTVCLTELAFQMTQTDLKFIKHQGYKDINADSYNQVKGNPREALQAESFYHLESLRHALEARISTIGRDVSKKMTTIYESITFCCMRFKEGRISWWNVIQFLNNHYPLYIK